MYLLPKDVRRMSDQSPSSCRTPLVTSRAFAVAFSRMCFRIRCPVLQASLPEVYNKTAEINGFTFLQLSFEDIQLCQTIHGRKNRLTSNHLFVYSAACQHVRPYSCVAVGNSSQITNNCTVALPHDQLNSRDSNPHSLMTHHDGVVSLTPNILFNTANS